MSFTTEFHQLLDANNTLERLLKAQLDEMRVVRCPRALTALFHRYDPATKPCQKLFTKYDPHHPNTYYCLTGYTSSGKEGEVMSVMLLYRQGSGVLACLWACPAIDGNGLIGAFVK